MFADEVVSRPPTITKEPFLWKISARAFSSPLVPLVITTTLPFKSISKLYSKFFQIVIGAVKLYPLREPTLNETDPLRRQPPQAASHFAERGRLAAARNNSLKRGSINLRRRKDSNLRCHFWHNGFQDRPFQPLTHASLSL